MESEGAGCSLAARLVAQGRVLDASPVADHARMRVRPIRLAVEGRGVARHGDTRLPIRRDVLAVLLACR